MTPSQCSDLAPSIRAPYRKWALRLLDRYFAAQALHKQHQALLRLDENLLRDVGITRAEATQQAASPVWDAPTHWKR
jgi:uncharacterized protein YjiS (DUF1127 family)